MAKVEQAPQRRSRQATSGLWRVLATLVALLLTASSLGQVAHFLLVPHAICAQHGELLELQEQRAHLQAAQHPDESDKKLAHASTQEAASAHDHCQVLARGQREQSLPPAPPSTLHPLLFAEFITISAAQVGAAKALTLLSQAPKTSPPRARFG
jgi:hypothetical protein